MSIFEKLKNGEPVDMMSGEFRPAVTEIHRADRALSHLNHAEPQTEEWNHIILLTALLIVALMLNACSSLKNEAVSEPSARSNKETAAETAEGDMKTMEYDFKQFPNVNITGIDLSSLTEEKLAVLYVQARYCQAMTDADIDTMRELVSEDMVFTHMSGRQQTREEYFADVADESLNYFTIGIADPAIKVDGDKAQITYTSVLNANAYGARGTYRMKGTHYYELRDGSWIAVNK